MKTITIGDFLTEDEVKEALALFTRLSKTGESFHYAKHCAAEIIRPNIDRINKALGQENDVMYLAYAVEYTIRESSK